MLKYDNVFRDLERMIMKKIIGKLLAIIITLGILGAIAYSLYVIVFDGTLPWENQKMEVSTSQDETKTESTLKLNVYPEINQLVEDYYKAVAQNDKGKLEQITHTYKESMVKPEIVDRYENFNIYTKPGLKENEYLVYAEFLTYIVNIKTPIPDLQIFYAYQEDGKWKLITDYLEHPKVNVLVEKYGNDQDIKDLLAHSEAYYDAAIESDPNLKSLVLMLESETNK